MHGRKAALDAHLGLSSRLPGAGVDALLLRNRVRGALEGAEVGTEVGGRTGAVDGGDGKSLPEPGVASKIGKACDLGTTRKTGPGCFAALLFAKDMLLNDLADLGRSVSEVEVGANKDEDFVF